MSRRKKFAYYAKPANAQKVSLSALQSRITRWRNQVELLSTMKVELERGQLEHQLLKDQKAIALRDCEKYRNAIWKLINEPNNYALGSRLFNLRAAHFGEKVTGAKWLKPLIREEVIRLHNLNQECKQNIEQQLADPISKVTAMLEKVMNQLRPNGHHRIYSHKEASELVEKKIDGLKAKLDSDLPILQNRKEQELAKEQKGRAVVAAFYGKTREEGARLKNQLNLTENCPYCDSPLKSNCQADHIYPVSKGGLSTVENMVYVCYKCNQKKAGLTLNQFIGKFSLDRRAIEKRLDLLGKDF